MNRSRITGDLVSQNNIFVDIANDRVGIGSTIPGEKLSLPDSAKIALGNSADLKLYYDGTHSYLESTGGTGNTLVKTGINALVTNGANVIFKSADNSTSILTGAANGAVTAYHNTAKKFETTAYGINVTGTTDTDGLVVSGVATVPQLGANLDTNGYYIFTSQSNGNIPLQPNGTGNVEVKGAGGNDGTLQLNCSANSHGIKLKSPPHSAGQTYTLTFPSSIVNNGFLKTDYSGNLSFAAVNTDLVNDTSPQLGGTLDCNGHSVSIDDNKEINFGDGDDLKIYHDGSHSYIHDGGTGNLKLRSNNFRVSNADESKISATFVPSGAVTLYNNNSAKFETTSSGIDVTGTVTADNQIVLNSGDSTPARIDLYCEVSNAHYTRLQAPAHSTYSGNVTATLPNVTGNLAVLANAANNRIVTATGTHAMTANSNLTFASGSGLLSLTGDFNVTGEVQIAGDIVHIGDGNTKIRFPSNDNISFEVAGVERLRIDNSDGVIAKHTTAANLRVQNSTAAASQVAQLDLAPAGSLSGVQLKATSEEDFSTGANRTAFFTVDVRKDGTFTERFRITSSGQFGFGNVTPGGTPANKNVFLAIGDSDTGIVQDGDGQLEIFGNAVEIVNFNAIDGYTSTKPITTTSNVTVGGNLTISDKIIHDGDTNTSIRFPANDTITFNTSNAERLRIDSNGNIGVNVTPASSGTLYNTVDHFLVIGDNDTGIAQDGDGQFEIWSNNTEIANFHTSGVTFTTGITVGGVTRIGNSSGSLGVNCIPATTGEFGGRTSKIAIGDNDTGLAQHGDGQLGFYANNSKMANINTNGMAINTGNSTSVFARLQIDSGTGGNNVPSNKALLFGTDGTREIMFLSNNGGTDTDGIIGSWNTVYNHQNAKIVFTKPSGNTGLIEFHTQNGSGITERMRIRNDGHIGINSTRPDSLVTIDSDTTDEFSVKIRNDNVGGVMGCFGDGHTYERQFVINASRTDSGATGALRLAGQNHIRFCADLNGERMRLDNSGRLGINHVPSVAHEYLTVKPNGNNVLDIAYRLNSSTDIRHKHYSDDGTYRGGFNYTRYSNSTRYPNLHHDHYWVTNHSGTSTQVSMRLTREGYLLQQYIPAFGVAQTTNGAQIAAGVYVFNEVYFNNGSHYNSANGRFTAPKAGAYSFSFSLQLYGGNAAHCRFQINGSDVFQNGTSGPVYEDGPDSHETISHTMVLNLAQGDYVHVARSGTTRGMQSSFCGHLIG